MLIEQIPWCIQAASKVRTALEQKTLAKSDLVFESNTVASRAKYSTPEITNMNIHWNLQ